MRGEGCDWVVGGVVNLLAPSPLCLHPGRLPGYYHHHVIVVVVVVVEVEVVKNGFMRGKVISRVEIPHHEVSKSYLNSCKGRWYGGGVGEEEEEVMWG